MPELIYRDVAKFQACNWKVKSNDDAIFDGIKESIKRLLDLAPAVDAIPVEWLMDKVKETEAQAEPHFAFMYVLHEWQETKSIEEQQAESEMRDLKAELKELLSEQEEHGI